MFICLLEGLFCWLCFNAVLIDNILMMCYFKFIIQQVLVHVCFLNHNISVSMLSSFTFNFVICFSFSMLLHGLTLGENDGDLEVCDTSLCICVCVYFIFQICFDYLANVMLNM